MSCDLLRRPHHLNHIARTRIKSRALRAAMLLASALGLFAALTAHGQPTDNAKNAFRVNERLGRGVNIEGYGGMTAAHYEAIRDAGFKNVRIPIHPFSQTLGGETHLLKPSFLKTLDQAVDMALANKLMPIIDFHEHNAMQKDPLGRKPMFLAIWKQLAEHYKDAPDEVLFEIANEPNMRPDIWNAMHGEAYRMIRQANPRRTLLIGPIYGNQIKYLKDLQLPEEDRNIIVTIHYYMPIQFTHQGAEWSPKNKDLSGIEWPNSDSGEQAIKDDFDMAQEWSKSHGCPLHLGEFGVYSKAGMDSRIRWTRFVARQAEERKWSWSYWELSQGFGIYDKNNGQWRKRLLGALIPEKDGSGQ
jgi:endoglucanase